MRRCLRINRGVNLGRLVEGSRRYYELKVSPSAQPVPFNILKLNFSSAARGRGRGGGPSQGGPSKGAPAGNKGVWQGGPGQGRGRGGI